MIDETTDKIIALYSNSFWKNIFAKLRFWYAPLREVERLVPEKGTVIDLGCGEGIFTNFVGITSLQRKVIGIEIDKNRLKFANRNLKNVSFRSGDISKVNIPSCNAITIFQVLHHLPTLNDQEIVLKKCKNALSKNGKLIIDEIYVHPSIRYLLTWLTDHFLVAWFFEKRLYSPILFRNINDWITLLKKTGFHCKVYFPESATLFSNVILECTKTKGGINAEKIS